LGTYRQSLSDEGLERIQLRSQALELSVLPGVGGKIFDLVDRRSGRNWLWHNPHLAPTRPHPNADFNLEQDSGGWDEILLSTSPADIETDAGTVLRVSDHGDLLGADWSVERLHASPDGDAVCDMAVIGAAAPYRFRRRIRLLGNRPVVKLDYALSNAGATPVPCYWCAHPLLAVERGSAIGIAGNMPLRVEDELTQTGRGDCSTQRWPELQLEGGDSVNLAESFGINGDARRFAKKLFVRSPDSGSVEVRLNDPRERLVMTFDPDELPWVGLWINNRGWSGCGSEPYMNLGLEPAMTPYDSVNEAIANDAIDWLGPGETRSWALKLELYM
jgi:galactose mutarotase-like enzyme